MSIALYRQAARFWLTVYTGLILVQTCLQFELTSASPLLVIMCEVNKTLCNTMRIMSDGADICVHMHAYALISAELCIL